MADPRIFVEPPIPVTTEFTDATHVRGVIQQLDQGNFRQPALLVERMMMNPRLRGVMNTRLAGLISAKIRFEPPRNNRDARRAAKEFAEDWPAMAPSPMRKQMMRWMLMLGFGVGQRVPDTGPTSGRSIFKVRPYWPGFANWYWAQKAYRIQTFDKGVTAVGSPSVERKIVEQFVASPFLDRAPAPEKSPWIIGEPFGVNSYRDGLVHAAWRPWLGHDWAMRDQARASQKHGIGAFKAKYPRIATEEGKASLAKFLNGLRTMGSEGVIPCEDDQNPATGGAPRKFDVEVLEFNGTGFAAIDGTMSACAVALAILFLGHNLTTEIKGGGSYAAAGVGEYIRDDVKLDDADAEWAMYGPQLAAPYCLLNYGDPELAPRANYETDSPTVSKQMAEMISALADAIALLRQHAPAADVEALLERFQIPLLPQGKRRVAVPETTPTADEPSAPDQTADDGTSDEKEDAA
jgi:hypothetical protein